MKKARGAKRKGLSARGFLMWERRFLVCAASEAGAARALERLEQIGLGIACRRLLWEYSEGQSYFAEIQEGVALIVRNLQAFDRAQRVWKQKSNDPRAEMFWKRFEEAASTLKQTPWPFRNPTVRTLGDRFHLTPSADLFQLRKIRGLMERSKLSFMLATLRAGARAHGSNLSGNQLAALARCASGQELDEGTVRRLLREPWIEAAEPGYSAVFEDFYCRACLNRST